MSAMNEDALRTLVREALARHLGAAAPGPGGGERLLVPGAHASHSRYALPASDGPCLIEPGVRCNHCGYCESHGH